MSDDIEEIKNATVGGLIEHLKTFDPNLPICVECFDCTYEYLVTNDRVRMGYIGTKNGQVYADEIDDGYLENTQPAVLIYV